MSPEAISESDVVDAVSGTEPANVPSLSGLLTSLALLLAHGAVAGREVTVLAAELVRIGLGRSEVEAAPGDWRFRDPTWLQNPVYHRLAQSYLAACRAGDNLVESLEENDWSHAQRAAFVMGILTSAAAPTNVLAGNPAALKKAFETGGRSLGRGLRSWLSDLRRNGGIPSTAKPGQLKIGVDLALTPGAVVARDEVAELIRYTPTSERVYERPTLIVPPPIGRYYFLDLAPGRSFVEHAVGRGIQTFMLSWRNPWKDQGDWSIDTYARRILSAIDEVREITGCEDVNLIGFCAGGILNTVALNHLAARGDKRVHTASYAVTLLDWSGPNPIRAFQASSLLSFAKRNSGRKGIIDARRMGSMFTWMRPNELVWNYWVNNYLLGQDPPAFDILSWNADGTNLPAKLHGQFLDIFRDNSLVEPPSREYLGTPLDLSAIDLPNFVVGAVKDHLTPWPGTYRTTQLVSGPSTYVLSNAGHIASLVNPPSNPRASHFTGDGAGSVDAETWRASATERPGSWWETWASWTIEQAGMEVPAPKELGSVTHPVLTDAPGLYVTDQLPE